MGRDFACCFPSRAGSTRPKHKQKPLQRSTETTGAEATNAMNEVSDIASEEVNENKTVMASSHNSTPNNNIIVNHNFQAGLHSWHPNCCDGYVVSSDSGHPNGVSAYPEGRYALITNRKLFWQGLEQDITDKVSAGSVYQVSARVGVLGPLRGPENVVATLKLVYCDSKMDFMFVGRTTVSPEQWKTLEGAFSLSTMPERIVFYLEGPSPGVDILVQSVVITCPGTPTECEEVNENNTVMTPSHNSTPNNNIIVNHNFQAGLHSWHPNCCDGFVVSPDSGHPNGVSAYPEGGYAVITNRKLSWHGLEQDITDKVSVGSVYQVSARVGVLGPLQGSENVTATLKLVYCDSKLDFMFVGRTTVSAEQWENLEGAFFLSTMPKRIVFYLEGPSPGIDLLVQSVVVTCSDIPGECESIKPGCFTSVDENVILNPTFDDGLNNWSGRGCNIARQQSMDGQVFPQSGKYFVSTSGRQQAWNGIQQEITGRVQRKLAYDVTAVVRIYGKSEDSSADVRLTLWVQTPDLREQYISIKSVQATKKDWVVLQGKFLLNASPLKVVIYLEGPPPGTDILLNNLSVVHSKKSPPSTPPVVENPSFGVNIIQNSDLDDSNGTNGWFALGNCTLSVGTGAPHILPQTARDSLGPHEPLSGRCILVTNRTQTWMGPAQIITDRVKLFLTYQVSTWVRVSSGGTRPQNVNVALSVDNQWVNAGQVEVNDNGWHEICGTFRIEKQPSKIMLYVQGPAVGLNLMVAGLYIFSVDRNARFKHLTKQTDKVRKRDVILKLSGSEAGSLLGAFLAVRQTKNSFPIGSCINRTNIDNEDFVNFFVKNFSWAVFGNELKWYWTEPQKGKVNYADADALLEFCSRNNIEARGHCIFWEVDFNVQQWVQSLNKTDLMKAVQNRLTGLLTRYKGKFRHYDVNNEMLHGSFYQDRLGKDARSNMFKTANQLDPSAALFVNDYHVEDGCDPKSSPEKYIQQVLDLQDQGAPVGGIGIQGHIDSPVGPIVSSALDKLGILGLPIWFTELDVSSVNEYVRADDLEVMLREAFAHPAVDGVMLWGFWELFMSRDNAHLVGAEGDLNEAGRRFLALKQEWLSHAHGHIDQQCTFGFRGFHGTYTVDIITHSKKVSRTFVVDKGDSPLEISLNI